MEFAIKKKKTTLPPGENNIYYFNIFEVHMVEVLFICLSIICISQSWLFNSSIFSLEVSLFEVYVIITHLLSILSMANIFCSLSMILFTMFHSFFFMWQILLKCFFVFSAFMLISSFSTNILYITCFLWVLLIFYISLFNSTWISFWCMCKMSIYPDIFSPK